VPGPRADHARYAADRHGSALHEAQRNSTDGLDAQEAALVDRLDVEPDLVAVRANEKGETGVGLTLFGDDVSPLVDLEPVAERRQRVSEVTHDVVLRTGDAVQRAEICEEGTHIHQSIGSSR
jgi:hypothetical protein